MTQRISSMNCVSIFSSGRPMWPTVQTMTAAAIICVVAVVSLGHTCWAVNSVVIQSDTVIAKTVDTIYVKLTNDAPIAGIVLPFVLRHVSPGSYVTSLQGEWNPKDRLSRAPGMGALSGYSLFNRYNVPDGNCKAQQPGGFRTFVSTGYTGPWGIDSAAIMSVCLQLDPTDPTDRVLIPGSDTAGGSLRLIFTANGTAGSFEIDTTCTDPGNHLLFDDTTSPPREITPSLTKGTITITPCTCSRQGDIDGSGFIDVTDVLRVIGIAFVNGTDVQDQACPKTRGDVNNDGVVDVNDVLYLIGIAFLNGPPPVDPCGP